MHSERRLSARGSGNHYWRSIDAGHPWRRYDHPSVKFSITQSRRASSTVEQRVRGIPSHERRRTDARDANHRWRGCGGQSKKFPQSRLALVGRDVHHRRRTPIAHRQRKTDFNYRGSQSAVEYTDLCGNSLHQPGRLKNCSDGFIESKYFSFQASDSHIRITETKHGLFSSIDFDSDGAIWLIKCLPKLRSGKVISRIVLSKCITLLLDGNHFGGYVRIFSGSDSIFIPEGKNGVGITRFIAGLSRAISTITESAPKQEHSRTVEQNPNGTFSTDVEIINDVIKRMDCYSMETKELTISDVLVHADSVLSGRTHNTLGISHTISSFDPSHFCSVLDHSISELKSFLQDIMNSSVTNLTTFLSKEYERIMTQHHESKKYEDGLAIEQSKDGNGGAQSEEIKENTVYTERRFEHSDFSDCDILEHGSSRGIGEYVDSDFGDTYLGHTSDNEKRTPISTVEDLWDFDTNQNICNKALLVTRDNCLPTSNLNLQMKTYKKRTPHSHRMKTRSQTRKER
ncbi:unnamed protein product [Cuscuta epithymum]|uniref:Uncharacterized protein n=1 Tax=Cuscuta epithymum TaxID=186058 RepID=A0AAV0CVW2_9ASTE|nr:unnamed protein product [Cuscuta epithymum]